jgi:hypothetical protein
VPLLRGGVPVRITVRARNDSWVRMYCPRCGASDEWPKPEYTCACGAIVRLPVDSSSRMRLKAASEERMDRPLPRVRPAPGREPGRLPPHYSPGGEYGRGGPGERRPAPQPAPPPQFRPLPIRTRDDALQTVVRYLVWLGCTGVHIAPTRGQEKASVRGPGIAAQVETWASNAELRAIELLWLHTLNENVTGVFFSAAGYTPDAAVRAEQLGISLFILDITGMPRPVNDTARAWLERSRH